MPNEQEKDKKGVTPNESEQQSTKDKTEEQNNNEQDNETEEQDEEDSGKKGKADEHLRKLKAENAQRRLENKTLKEQLERQNKALAILQGKDKPDLDPVEQAKAAADTKLRNALLRAELANVARDAHDPSVLFQVGAKELAAVDVDVDGEVVDREALEEAVDKLRKQRPFLFKAAEDNTTAPRKGAPLPKDGGQPTNGKNHMAIWKQLKDQGRAAEASAYYQKNRAEIMAQMKTS